MTEKDFIDEVLQCSVENKEITIRCTADGVISCIGWQRCESKRFQPERMDCLMNKFIVEVPKEVERMKKERDDYMLGSMISYMLFQKELKKRGIETHGEAMARRRREGR